MRMGQILLAVIVAVVIGGGAGPALARAPLLVDGTHALHQRVLTRPDAVLTSSPDGQAVRKPPVFSPYYVFARRDMAGISWLELGADPDGARTAWMRADQTVPWNHTIVLSFTNPANRLPVLFFDARQPLEALVGDEVLGTRAELLAGQVRAGQVPPDSGVIAVEPPEQVSIIDRFYILPVLEAPQISVNHRRRKLVRVASVNMDATTPPPADPFRVGIVFVIDTSKSMGPYIERTHAAVREVLARLRGSPLRDRVSIGMVGFRSSTARTPALEYTSRVFYPLRVPFDQTAFLAALTKMTATTASSHAFDEDGLSGLRTAAEMPGWTDFGGRYVIYITDAGMLVGVEQGSSASTTPELLATRMRKDLGIAVFSLYLATPAGAAYRDDALAQLGQISRIESSRQPLVFTVPNGAMTAFGQEVDSLVKALVAQVQQQEGAAAGAPACPPGSRDIACQASAVGKAMRLAWLGRQQGTQAPAFYEAWAAEFALDDPSRRAMDMRVLLTRNQLNDLTLTLEAISEAATASLDADPQKFFTVLKTTLANVLRDPARLRVIDPAASGRAAQLAEFDDLGDLLDEYFAGLPYLSDLAGVTPEIWEGMGDTGRHEFLQAVQQKISFYKIYYDDAPHWVKVNEESGEEVYPVPLEMMP